MEEEKIIEALDKFMEKQGLDDQGKYFITKKMNEEYWELIRDGEEPEEEEVEQVEEIIETLEDDNEPDVPEEELDDPIEDGVVIDHTKEGMDIPPIAKKPKSKKIKTRKTKV